MLKWKKIFAVLAIGWFAMAGSALALDFPFPDGYVTDAAGIIGSDQAAEIESVLDALEKNTGVEVAVVTVAGLQETTIEDFAVRLFEEWGIGKAGEDNGLLILIAQEEREVKIEVGYGLEPVITDGRAGQIIRDQMLPRFRSGDYGGGVMAAVRQIEGYVTGGESPADVQAGASADGEEFVLPLIVMGILFVYVASFLGRTKRVWPGGVAGGLFGWLTRVLIGGGGWLIFAFGFFGLFLDLLFSSNYKKLKNSGKPTTWRSSWGGFSTGGGWKSSGGGRSGGFGGFGGGRSGGGGAKGSW